MPKSPRGIVMKTTVGLVPFSVLVLAVLCTTAFSLPNGLIAYYPFDGDAMDYSNNGNNGTIYGPTWVTGYYGSALHFNGAGDYVSVQDKGSLVITNGLSICAWIKPELGNMWYRVVGKSNSSNSDDCWGIGEAMAGGICFTLWKGGNQTYTNGQTPLQMNQWNHIVGTWDGSVMHIYQNGVLQPETEYITPPIDNSVNPLYIGKLPNNTYYFKGAVDEVMIFNRALSASEVDSIFRGTYLTDSTTPVVVPYVPKVTLDRRPRFVWHPVSLGAQYTLAVSDTASFTNPVILLPLSDTVYAPDADLPIGPIRWRVRLNTGTRWSQPDNFVIQSDSVPFLVRFNGGLVNNVRPTFSWYSVSQTTAYRIEMANNPLFTNTLVTLVSDTTFIPLADLAPGLWFWRVSSSRNYSLFCVPDSFQIVPVSVIEKRYSMSSGKVAGFIPGGSLCIYSLSGRKVADIVHVNGHTGVDECLAASRIQLSPGVYFAVTTINGMGSQTFRFLHR